MQDVFILYEGYTLRDYLSIRVLKNWASTKLFVSNAAGAINLKYKRRKLMLLDDRINLQGGSPLAKRYLILEKIRRYVCSL
jgi:purine-nucleoside phosphorylase